MFVTYRLTDIRTSAKDRIAVLLKTTRAHLGNEKDRKTYRQALIIQKLCSSKPLEHFLKTYIQTLIIE